MRRTPRWLGTVGSIGLLCSLVAATPALGGGGAPPAGAEPRGSFADQLNGVVAVSATDVWAVGSEVTSHRFLGRALIKHFNGKKWERVAGQGPGGGALTTLLGVSAAAANDVWAVGNYSDQSSHALIEHWDGTSWQFVPAPDLGNVSAVSLQGVSALSAADVWAVGGYQRNSRAHTLVEHWDGTSWSVVDSPSPGGLTGVRLLGVSAVSATDVWAVGYTGIGTSQKPLVEHWDGTSWTVVPGPNPEGDDFGDDLAAVDAISTTDVWAVGASIDFDGSLQKGIAEHWDGAAWNVIRSGNHKKVQTQVYSVSALSATDVWAVGVSSHHTFIQRWDGQRWRPVANPSPGQVATLSGVSALTSTDAWAVGVSTDETEMRSLIEHWDGTSWQLS